MERESHLVNARFSLLTPRRPLVLFSESGNSTYAANLLQGLFAIPQFREAIMVSVSESLATQLYMSGLISES